MHGPVLGFIIPRQPFLAAHRRYESNAYVAMATTGTALHKTMDVAGSLALCYSHCSDRPELDFIKISN